MTRPKVLAVGLVSGVFAILCAPALADGFASLDANGDGAVDRAEWTDASTTRFDGYDGNGDGQLNAIEIATIPVAPGASAERLREARQREYQAMDADGDGLVSRAEYVEVGLRRFQMLDRDGDGRIVEAEVRSSGRRGG